MSVSAHKNIPASIKARLLNISKERKENFVLTLNRYSTERLLYRIGISDYKDNFILKGARLLSVYFHDVYRPTKDIDLLGTDNFNLDRMKMIIQAICRIQCPEDGIYFDPKTVSLEDIQEQNAYHGMRVKLIGYLENTKLPLQVDIDFGDAVFPKSKIIQVPTMLNMPSPSIFAYPIESIIAEKLEILISLGIANSRLKDYYDLYMVFGEYELRAKNILKSVKATFGQRKTAIPSELPPALTRDFYSNQSKKRQWTSFLKRINTDLELEPVVSRIAIFFTPFLHHNSERGFPYTKWSTAGKWVK
jgi:predicted nucleotidyltransferase component of viral defense system